MKKYCHEIVGILIALLVLIGDIFYILYGKLWIKGTTSSLFFLLGLYFFAFCVLKKKRIRFALFMVIALFLTMIADIVLNIHFISGAILFAVGHILYMISYMMLHKWHWRDLLISGILMIPSVLWLTLSSMFDYGGVLMEIVVVAYAIIISFMVGKAISNWMDGLLKEKNSKPLELVIMIGSLLFFFSDCMLLLNVFADFPRVVDILCLATYYPAQILLATSIYIYKNS